MDYFPNRLTSDSPSSPHQGAKNWVPVTRFTRASAAGRPIKCPNCGAEHRVFHFSWSALQCLSCEATIEKSHWSYEA